MATAVMAVVLMATLAPRLMPATKPQTSVDQLIYSIAGWRWVVASPFALLVSVMLITVTSIWSRVSAAAQAVAHYVDDPRSEAATGSMSQVSEQLGRLIREALSGKSDFEDLRRSQHLAVMTEEELRRYPRTPRRFVIIVDDLERCRPPRAVEICEVASQLLSHQNVVTILLADMAAVAAAAEVKYARDAGADAIPRIKDDRSGSPTAILTGTYGSEVSAEDRTNPVRPATGESE